jgi:nitrogen fixation protein FixH
MMQTAREIKISGRMVLGTIVTFFIIIAAVNATMVTLAVRTFGGLETENAYKAGLEFARSISYAKAQQTRDLKVDIVSSRQEGGRTNFTLTAEGPEITASSPLTARLEFRHPADKRHDHTIELQRISPGVFAGAHQIEPGQWNVRVSLERGGERVFHSINRITIK